MAQKYFVPGPCTVSWGGVDCGYTKAGVIIRPNTNMIPVVDDEHGSEPADWILGGKSAIVEVVFNDPAKLKLASLAIGKILSVMDGADTQVGKLAFDGATGIGKELIITERDDSNLWKAKYTMPSDPQQLMLASTQEFLSPVLFVVAFDEADKLFYVVPSYLSS